MQMEKEEVREKDAWLHTPEKYTLGLQLYLLSIFVCSTFDYFMMLNANGKMLVMR